MKNLRQSTSKVCIRIAFVFIVVHHLCCFCTSLSEMESLRRKDASQKKPIKGNSGTTINNNQQQQQRYQSSTIRTIHQQPTISVVGLTLVHRSISLVHADSLTY